MADTIAQDVVNQSQSVGDLTPSDAAATTTTTNSNPLGDVDGIAEGAAKENGLHAPTILPDLEDASAKSDTDGSRAEGSVAGDKPAEAKPIKKFAAAKPVFAKYSVPKVIAANATSKGLDKGNALLCQLRLRRLTDNRNSYNPGIRHTVFAVGRASSASSQDSQFVTAEREIFQTRCPRPNASMEQESR